MVQRYRRGIPATAEEQQRTIQQPTTEQQQAISQQQRLQLQSEIDNLRAKVAEIERQRRENRFNQGEGAIISRSRERSLQRELSGVIARLNYYTQSLSQLPQGSYYRDISTIQAGAAQSATQARRVAISEVSYAEARAAERARQIQVTQTPQYVDVLGQGVSAAPEAVQAREARLASTQMSVAPEAARRSEFNIAVQRAIATTPQAQRFSTGDRLIIATGQAGISVAESGLSFFPTQAMYKDGQRISTDINLSRLPVAGKYIQEFKEIQVYPRERYIGAGIFAAATLKAGGFKLSSLKGAKKLTTKEGRKKFFKEDIPYFFEAFSPIKPRTGTFVIRPPREPTAREFKLPVVVGGKERVFSYYVSAQETTALTRTLKPTWQGTTFKISQPKIAVRKTPFGAIDQEPFIVAEQIVGRKQLKVYRLGGKSESTNLQQINLKIPINRKLLRELAEMEKGRLIPIRSRRKTLQTFPRSQKFEYGFVESKYLLKGGQRGYKIIPPGRRETAAQTLSIIKPYVETSSMEILTGRTSFKDITKPFARQTGKPSSLKFDVTIFKKPYVIGGKPQVYGKTYAGGPKTPFSKTFLQAKTDLISTKIPPIKQAKQFTSPTQTRAAPPVSDFYGTGQYGLTEETGAFSFGRIQRPTSVTGITAIGPIQRPTTRATQAKIPSTRLTTKQFPVQERARKEIYSLAERGALKIQPRQKLTPRQKLAQRTTLRLTQRLTQRLVSRRAMVISPITMRKPPITLLPFKMGAAPVSQRGLFAVEVRRRGKFRTIAKVTDFTRAVSIGREVTSRTLAASFRIKGVGKSVIPFGFRPSKREPGVIVELPKFRLSKRSEKKEIQMFRRALR